MIVDNDFNQLFEELSLHDHASVTVADMRISIRIFEDTKLSLSTLVYDGGNYIPQSVRHCLTKKPPFESPMQTHFLIDEENFQISLNYLGQLGHFNSRHFQDLIEDYIELADQWRLYLDEHDRKDLVHVRVG